MSILADEHHPIVLKVETLCTNQQLEVEVKDLFRIENVKNWFLYEALKETVEYDNGGQDPEVTRLYHGCPHHVVNRIIAGGLNRIYCDPTGRMGCATYVTNSMRVALEHARENAAVHKYVFMCDALIGTIRRSTPCILTIQYWSDI